MKAAVFEGVEQIVVREWPDPRIKPDEILVKVACCAICGTDIRIYHQGHKAITPPSITGHELAGVIVKVGREVTGFNEGDGVTVATSTPCLRCSYCEKGLYNICDNLTGVGYDYNGGFAEYMVVPAVVLKANNLIKLPDGLSLEEACMPEPFACVINGQELSQVKDGDTVAIIGAGPIGCMHTSVAKLRGAKEIILLELSQDRLDLAKDLPVDHFINTSKEDMVKTVTDITGGAGADVVIVAAPSSKAQEDGLQIVAKRGRLNLFGGLPRTNPRALFDSNRIHYGEIFVHGSYGPIARQQKEALRLFSTGKIEARKFVSAKLPLEKILDGFKMTEEKKCRRVVINL